MAGSVHTSVVPVRILAVAHILASVAHILAVPVDTGIPFQVEDMEPVDNHLLVAGDILHPGHIPGTVGRTERTEPVAVAAYRRSTTVS